MSLIRRPSIYLRILKEVKWFFRLHAEKRLPRKECCSHVYHLEGDDGVASQLSKMDVYSDIDKYID